MFNRDPDLIEMEEKYNTFIGSVEYLKDKDKIFYNTIMTYSKSRYVEMQSAFKGNTFEDRVIAIRDLLTDSNLGFLYLLPDRYLGMTTYHHVRDMLDTFTFGYLVHTPEMLLDFIEYYYNKSNVQLNEVIEKVLSVANIEIDKNFTKKINKMKLFLNDKVSSNG